MNYAYQSYLAHFGIKGQKWGVRRYQNEDGTMTADGRSRYLASDGRLSENDKRALAGLHEKRQQLTPEQATKRKATAKKVLTIAAGVTVAAALGYGAYKGGRAYGNWRHDNNLRVAAIGRQMTNLQLDRLQSKQAGGWTKAAEDNYRRNMRMLNRSQLGAYFGRKTFAG